MTHEDTVRTLLTSISTFTSRDWGSVEKNSRAIELARAVTQAIHMRDRDAMQGLFKEINHFMAPTFVLFKRMERLVERHQGRTWRTAQDNTTWGNLMKRTSIVVKRRDGAELLEIATRAITFLSQRNEHVLAKSLQEALDMCSR